jgi:hypothetical protein
MNDCINDGGPAFPNPDRPHTEPGISKREYFAAKAMQALLSRDLSLPGHVAATEACLTADFMLAALGQKPAESVNAELLEAAKTVLADLNARIEQAPNDRVPVFNGIADLHTAIARAEAQQ